MMQHRNTTGERLAYRPVTEAELSRADRRRIDDAQARMERARCAQDNLIQMAGRDMPGFDQLSRWIVGTCRVGSEESIADEMTVAGIEAWCPMEKFRKPPRRALPAVDVFRPFFRGYLFVRVIPSSEAFAGVLCASRLTGLMGRGGEPYLMPERIMSALKLGSKKGKTDEDVEGKYPPGATVVIRSGPFADFQATVRRVIGSRWALEAEVNLFGRMTPVELDIDSISASA
ncbi:transcriptional antiterminator [Rhizobium sp. S95]|uniref:Transcription termination/antitermination protein NusG n=1 Tax=Ciceribacter sichuanensis TaxID=2949647 RepID=A0AAJ1BXC3_9HYPH|nr:MULTISPECIES: transcription termination/antitermination NusG family protein [unclassified Ciceribacter]MCM2396202.1 transcriptional antiterminator [Ciceribacter sp. S95]MCO5957647.1 transcriptional antiterminator [Ciceribacter sp. S101]